VEIHDLVKSYSRNNTAEEEIITVLDGVDLEITMGDFSVITGASGNGKTTLLGIISGLCDYDSGSVRVLDHEYSTMTWEEKSLFRTAYIGHVFQDFFLIDELNALENVMLPRELAGTADGRTEEIAGQLLEKFGLADRKDHFPHQLSGGEKQRVSIARSLVNAPQILLVDEPTTNLDPVTASTVLDYLVDIKDSLEMTVISVTNDPKLIEIGDRVLVVENKNVREF